VPIVQRGFTLAELLVSLAILLLLAAIAVPLYQSALLRSRVGAGVAESRTLLGAFEQYRVDQDRYPDATGSSRLQLDTFEPLVSLGYYRGGIESLLLDQRADAYDAPDGESPDQEFWLEMTLAADPSVRFLIADSDDAPLASGAFVDGISLFRNGELTAVRDVR